MDHSPLAKLPTELRDYIWELVLRSSNSTISPYHSPYNARTDSCHKDLDLFLTCRQIYQEASKRLYATHTFIIHQTYEDRWGVESFKTFLHRIGTENVKHLHAVCVDYRTSLSPQAFVSSTFQQALRDVKALADGTPDGSVKVDLTFLPVYQNIDIRVLLDIQAVARGREGAWVEWLEPSDPSADADEERLPRMQEDLDFLLKWFRETEQDLKVEHMADC